MMKNFRPNLPRSLSIAFLLALPSACGPSTATLQVEVPAHEAPGQVTRPLNGRTEMAFFYVPQHAAGTWLLNDFSTGLGFNGMPGSLDVQTQYRRDLATMAAMGAKTIKIGYEASSAVPNQGLTHEGPLTFLPNAGATRNVDNLRRGLANLTQAIALARGLGLRVVVEFFMNSQTYLRGPNGFYPSNNPTWFDYSYANFGADGISRMTEDLSWWVVETIRALESNGAGGSVQSYSLMTEASYDPRSAALTSTLTRMLLSRAPVDHRRLGMTALPDANFVASNTWQQQQDIISTGRWIGFTGLHSYPASGVNPVETWAASKAVLERTFQGVQLEVGEFGVEFCVVGRDERTQASYVSWGLNEANRLGFARLFNWGLWDYGPNQANCGSKWGLGFSAEAPRDAYGVMSEWASDLRQGDFEQSLAGWSDGAAGPGTNTLSRMGPYSPEAATGDWYLRHASTAATNWVCSSPFAVNGNYLAVAGYVRAAGPLTMAVHTKTPQGWTYATGVPAASLSLADGPWVWRSVSGVLDGKMLPLRPATSEAILCFVSSRSAGGSSTYIDLDALSATGIEATAPSIGVAPFVQCGGANVLQRGACHPSEVARRCAKEPRSPTGFAWANDDSCL
jgi:hypothetical protein